MRSARKQGSAAAHNLHYPIVTVADAAASVLRTSAKRDVRSGYVRSVMASRRTLQCAAVTKLVHVKQRFFDNMPWMTKNENPPILAIGRSVHEKIARFMVNGVVG